MIFGIHIAIIGEVYPDIANVDVMVVNRMYVKLKTSPIPILTPIPPFTFFDDNVMPITVNIKAAAVIAYRLCISISKLLILATPLSFCRSIYVFN